MATYWYYFTDYPTAIFAAINRSDPGMRRDREVPVAGSLIACDIFKKAWAVLRSPVITSYDSEHGFNAELQK